MISTRTGRPARRMLCCWKAIVSVAAAAALGALLFWKLVLASGPRPGVILISIDSLRPDHLGCYGYSRDTSPNLDRLAAGGALFETVVSSTSWTLPAHAALFTGQPGRVHGCIHDRRWLDGSRWTLAEAFRDAGYTTAGFFSGPYLHPSFGLSQGFQSYQDCTSYSGEFIRDLREGKAINEKGVLDWELAEHSHADITNPILLRAVTKWLKNRPPGPFFLFIHMWDVHYDYVPPPPFDRKFDPGYRGAVDGRGVLRYLRRPADWTEADLEHLEALYDGEIAWTDDTLGKILGELKGSGLADRSIIAVTADHGEAFYEHGVHGHRWSLHEEEIRIPFLLRYPPAVAPGRRIRRPLSIIDIAPTLLDLAGLPALPDALGKSVAPVLRDPQEELGPELCISELQVPIEKIHQFALRSADWKLLIDLENRGYRYYDLRSDPGEQRPLAEDERTMGAAEIQELYRDTARRLEEAARRLPVPAERDTPPISTMTESELRSLGYLK